MSRGPPYVMVKWKQPPSLEFVKASCLLFSAMKGYFNVESNRKEVFDGLKHSRSPLVSMTGALEKCSVFNLVTNGIKVADTFSIASLFQFAPNLRRLNVSNSCIGDTAVHTFAIVLANTNLPYLVLKHTRIRKEVAMCVLSRSYAKTKHCDSSKRQR